MIRDCVVCAFPWQSKEIVFKLKVFSGVLGTPLMKWASVRRVWSKTAWPHYNGFIHGSLPHLTSFYLFLVLNVWSNTVKFDLFYVSVNIFKDIFPNSSTIGGAVFGLQCIWSRQREGKDLWSGATVWVGQLPARWIILPLASYGNTIEYRIPNNTASEEYCNRLLREIQNSNCFYCRC